MPTPIDGILVPVHAMPLSVPTKVLHAMSAQGRLVIDLTEDDTPYDSWADRHVTTSAAPPCMTRQ
jgi:hypothetical protein